MILQTVHIAKNGTAVPTKPAAGGMPYWIVATDGKHLVGFNGASLANDKPFAAVRVWAPADIGAATIVGAVYKPADTNDSHEGVAVALSDGRSRPGHFS